VPGGLRSGKAWAALAIGAAAAAWAGWIWLGADEVLKQSREAADRAGRIDLLRTPVGAPPAHATPLAAVLDVRAAVEFAGGVYLAGAGGVERYSAAEGALERRWNTGFELPRARVTGLAVGIDPGSGRRTVLASTAGEGVLVLEDGARWEQARAAAAELRDLTCLLALDDGRILLGTERAGVLVWDASGAAPLHPELGELAVTVLAGEPGRIWIGTLDEGVLSLQGGSIERYSTEQGVPDVRVLSLSSAGDRVYVGTAAGVAEISEAGVERTFAEGVIAAAVAIEGAGDGERLWVGSFDQGTAEIDLRRRSAARSASWLDEPREVRAFARLGEELFVVAADGARSLESDAAFQSDATGLRDRNISALLEDSRGRLWVGYFDRGLDVLAEDRRRLFSIEDDLVFCVNRLVEDVDEETVYVATANGLVAYSMDGRRRQVLGKKDGLFADHVTDLVRHGEGWAIATPAGLNFWGDAGVRGVYALQGLVNNHVYALAARGERLAAGTLGGLSLLAGERVERSLSTADSELGHNWIAAAEATEDGWWLGTYGAGVQALGPDGRLTSYPDMAGVEINPNALDAAAPATAGTLDRGVLLYDADAERWTARQQGLPSPNVTAVERGRTRIYLGTDNGLVAWAADGLVF